MTLDRILKFSIGPIGLGVLGVISIPLTSWFFSPADLGVLAMLQVVIGLGVMACTLGLDQSYAREYYSASKKGELLLLCFFPGILVVFVLGAIGFLVGFDKVSLYIYGFLDDGLGLLSLACVFLAIVARFISVDLRLQERPIFFSASQLLPKSVFLIGVGIIASGIFLPNYRSLTLSHLAGLLAVVVLFSSSVYRKIETPGPSSGADLKELMRYGLPLVLTGVAAWGLRAVDKMMLRSFSGLEELGVYSVAVTIASGAALVTSVFNTIWSPIVYKWAAENALDEKLEFSSQLVLACVFLIFTFSGAFAWLLGYLLPIHYEKVIFLIPLCLVAPLFYSLSEAVAIGINLSRKTSYSVYATLIALGLGVVSGLFLIPRFGADGAALSSAMGFFFYLVLRTEFAQIVWRPFSRKKLYFVALILFFVAALHAFVGQNDAVRMEYLWGGLFVSGLYFFRAEVRWILFFLRKRSTGKSSGTEA